MAQDRMTLAEGVAHMINTVNALQTPALSDWPQGHESTWTIAYRTRTARRFLRVANWYGTWDDASAFGRAFVAAHPELDVYTVQTASYEDFVPWTEDYGHLMVPSGRRVRIYDLPLGGRTRGSMPFPDGYAPVSGVIPPSVPRVDPATVAEPTEAPVAGSVVPPAPMIPDGATKRRWFDAGYDAARAYAADVMAQDGPDGVARWLAEGGQPPRP